MDGGVNTHSHLSYLTEHIRNSKALSETPTAAPKKGEDKTLNLNKFCPDKYTSIHVKTTSTSDNTTPSRTSSRVYPA